MGAFYMLYGFAMGSLFGWGVLSQISDRRRKRRKLKAEG